MRHRAAELPRDGRFLGAQDVVPERARDPGDDVVGGAAAFARAQVQRVADAGVLASISSRGGTEILYERPTQESAR